MTHEFLIDGEGRRWCADDCPAESPHWTGEFETDDYPGQHEGPWT